MNKQLALKSHAQLYQTIRPFLTQLDETIRQVKVAVLVRIAKNKRQRYFDGITYGYCRY